MSANSRNDSNLESSIDDDAELLALEQLLRHGENADETPTEKKSDQRTISANPSKFVPKLVEDESFAQAFSYELDLPTDKLKEAAIAAAAKVRNEEIDSSDDEEVRNFLERKYNEYGADINKRLKQRKEDAHENKVTREIEKALRSSSPPADNAANDAGSLSKQNNSKQSNSFLVKKPETPKLRQSLLTTSVKTAPTYTDPVFGLRIINPLVSSALLTERMADRQSVPFSALVYHIERGDLNKDWVVAGVIVNKHPVQSTKKGQPYSIWRLTDLRGEIKMISLFLFGSAHKDLWKTAEGMCIAVLNPTIFEKRAKSGDIACLSIDTAQKVMVLGQSKDLGICRAKKRNGDACTAVVNTGECDYCIFHMKQEYGKMSRRSELQSASNGRGLNELRNKVLGKSEVFYGGQSYSAIPAKKSSKLAMKDSQRLSSLSDYAVSPFASSVNHTSKPKSFLTVNAVPYAAHQGRPESKIAGNVEATTKQRLKDMERLRKLKGEVVEVDNETIDKPTTSKAAAQIAASAEAEKTLSSPKLDVPKTPSHASLLEKYKNREFSSFLLKTPKLSTENFCIEVSIGEKRAALAKMKAARVLQQKPIQKLNPNSVRGTKEGKRRAIDELNEKFQLNSAKKQKLEEEQRELEKQSRIQRIMNATSSHKNLVDQREQQEEDKYFSKLEKKEALEEKMLNTYKMPCKAVICKICKYTAFSASDRCKEQRHPLKVVDAEKRFFQCKDCGNRTVTVFKIPKTSCKNCQGSHWMRTAMIKERICGNNPSESLSIRGDEEAFLGSLATKTNLNLLVPDEE